MKRLEILYTLCIEGKATPAETQEFRRLLIAPENNGIAKDLVQKAFITQKSSLQDVSSQTAEAVLQVIFNADRKVVRPVHRVHFLRTAWFRYAAALIAILSISSYLWLSNRNQPASTTANNTQHKNSNADILPGANKATLTLADGSKVILDNTAANNITNTNIIKIDANQLAYNQAQNLKSLTEYNTVSTPKGSQYQITLSDGTKVWLNAMSSIHFPTAFTSTNRTVDITGEAYMEISKNSKQPFFVKTGGAEVQVLGTSFNINAYANETAIKTTLVEGSVKVNTINASELLKPGQQAKIDKNKVITLISGANVVQQAIAWKNGVFNFEGLGVKEVMNQLQRWYDIEVIYESGEPDITFVGEMDKSEDLAVVLTTFKNMGIHFRREGKRLIVTQ